jgi:uncharacterized protein (DUF4213/DUF364 family)
MGIDNLSLDIERRALTVGYINAFIEFCEEKEKDDYEDVLEMLHPILKDKIKQEFIEKNFLPHLKVKNPFDSFFS